MINNNKLAYQKKCKNFLSKQKYLVYNLIYFKIIKRKIKIYYLFIYFKKIKEKIIIYLFKLLLIIIIYF